MIVVVFWSVFSNQSLMFLSMKKTFLYNGGCGPNGSDFSKVLEGRYRDVSQKQFIFIIIEDRVTFRNLIIIGTAEELKT